jgi:hypothetical protein
MSKKLFGKFNFSTRKHQTMDSIALVEGTMPDNVFLVPQLKKEDITHQWPRNFSWTWQKGNFLDLFFFLNFSKFGLEKNTELRTQRLQKMWSNETNESAYFHQAEISIRENQNPSQSHQFHSSFRKQHTTAVIPFMLERNCDAFRITKEFHR